MRQKKSRVFVSGEVVSTPLESVKPNGWNPNSMTAFQKKGLREGMIRNGWLASQALLVWGTDEKGETKNLIIDGEHRYEAAKAVGFEHGPMVFLNGISEKKAKSLTVEIDAKRGRFNQEALSDLVRSLYDEETISLEDYSMQMGIDQDELHLMIDPTDGEAIGGVGVEKKSDDDVIPEPPKAPRVKRGELWMLGKHRLLCGDTFVDEHRLRLMGNEKADAILMDPPYAIYGSSSGIAADIADDKMVIPFFESLARIAMGTVKDYGHVYTCCDFRSVGALYQGNRQGGAALKNTIVWDKGGGGLGSSFAICYELIVFTAKLPNVRTLKHGRKAGQRIVNAPNIQRFPPTSGDERKINASKPVALFELFVKVSTDEGEIVVDFFGGSGTTLIACEKQKRRCFMMEENPAHADIVIERWERLTGQRAKRVAA